MEQRNSMSIAYNKMCSVWDPLRPLTNALGALPQLDVPVTIAGILKMNGNAINALLQFYQLPGRGNVAEKGKRLLSHWGVC